MDNSQDLINQIEQWLGGVTKGGGRKSTSFNLPLGISNRDFKGIAQAVTNHFAGNRHVSVYRLGGSQDPKIEVFYDEFPEL